MSGRRHLFLSIASSLVLILGGSRVARGAGPIEIKDDASTPATDAGTAVGPATCTLEPGSLVSNISFNWPEDVWTEFAWRIPSCPSCGIGAGLEVRTVAFRMRWFAACSATAEVSIVGAAGAASCPAPDTTRVLFGPASFPLTSVGPGAVLYTLTLPSGWCVGESTFARIRFVGLCNSAPTPTIYEASDTCDANRCDEYFTTANLYPSQTAWCSASPVGTHMMWMQITGDCCTVTGVGPENPAHASAQLAVLDNLSRHPSFRFSLAGNAPRAVVLELYDIAGRRVRELWRGDLAGGVQVVNWDGTSDSGARLPSGVYAVRLRAGSASTSATVLLRN